jgi:hypothetical protein
MSYLTKAAGEEKEEKEKEIGDMEELYCVLLSL